MRAEKMKKKSLRHITKVKVNDIIEFYATNEPTKWKVTAINRRGFYVKHISGDISPYYSLEELISITWNFEGLGMSCSIIKSKQRLG